MARCGPQTLLREEPVRVWLFDETGRDIDLPIRVLC